MAQYNASQLISASNATYVTNVTGNITAADVRTLNDSWVSSSAILSDNNTFSGNQIISGNVNQSGTFYADTLSFYSSSTIQQTTGSYVMTYDSNGTVTYDTYPNVAAALQPYINTGSFDTSSLVSNATFNSYTQSTNNTIAGLETTASFNTFSQSYVTDSASFNSRINAATGSSIYTGSFATTGSNSFTGSQNILSGSITQRGGRYNTVSFPQFTQTGYNSNATSQETSSINPFNWLLNRSGSAINQNTTIAAGTINLTDVKGNSYSSLAAGFIQNQAANQTASLSIISYDATSFTYDNEFWINASGVGTQFTDWDNNTSANSTTPIMQVGPNNGSQPAPQFPRGLVVTGSAIFAELTGSLATFSASVNTRINSGGGGSINTGSFATTGSNTFKGNQIVSGTFFQSGSNTLGGTELGGTFIKNRVIIGGTSGGDGPTPRLWISGSDGRLNTQGGGFVTADTTKVRNLTADFTAYASTASAGASLSLGVYDPYDFTTDIELNINVNTGSGIVFKDFDNVTAFDYIPFMSVAPNLGNNPIPVMTRGLIVNNDVSVGNTITASVLQLKGNAKVWFPTLTYGTSSYVPQVATDGFQFYQSQGQPYAFQVNTLCGQYNGISGSQFTMGLQTNGSGTSTFGGANYFALISGSLSQSVNPGTEIKGGDQLVNSAGGLEIVYTYSNAGFARKVYVNSGLYVSGSGGAKAITTNGDVLVTGSVEITSALRVPSIQNNVAITGSLNVSATTTLQNQIILTAVSQSYNFTDDTQAAANGIQLGGLYRNGNFVMIRMT